MNQKINKTNGVKSLLNLINSAKKMYLDKASNAEKDGIIT